MAKAPSYNTSVSGSVPSALRPSPGFVIYNGYCASKQVVPLNWVLESYGVRTSETPGTLCAMTSWLKKLCG